MEHCVLGYAIWETQYKWRHMSTIHGNHRTKYDVKSFVWKLYFVRLMPFHFSLAYFQFCRFGLCWLVQPTYQYPYSNFAGVNGRNRIVPWMSLWFIQLSVGSFICWNLFHVRNIAFFTVNFLLLLYKRGVFERHGRAGTLYQNEWQRKHDDKWIRWQYIH